MSADRIDTLTQPRLRANPFHSAALDAHSHFADPAIRMPAPSLRIETGHRPTPSASSEGPDISQVNAPTRPPGRGRNVGRLLTRLQLRLLGLVSPENAARRGVEMFCTPQPAPAAAVDADDAAEGAQLIVLQVDGHELATYVWGDPHDQPYVLLAHGWSGHALAHLAWVAALRAAGYAVVAFDQQAHGRSSGSRATLPDFVCNLLAVGWKHGRAAAVIGYSLGGAAAAIALSHGLQADRAILISAQADPEDAIGRFADCVGLASSTRRRMIALLEKRTGVEMDALQAHRTVPQIGRPALVVHDMEDQEVPWAEGERYARYWPDSRLLTTTGLGHGRIADDPQVIASCLRFLQGKTVGERVVSSPDLPYGLA
jgi:pimeloyl-ACP methyl ester carboxylesterase